MPGASEFTTRPELAGPFGMVASTHWLASAAGLSVLEKGGNAFDAAAAAGLVLQVIEPHLSGPGGEAPIIGFDVRRGQTFVVDGQGPAPRTATVGAFAALDVDLIPGNGLLAARLPADPLADRKRVHAGQQCRSPLFAIVRMVSLSAGILVLQGEEDVKR